MKTEVITTEPVEAPPARVVLDLEFDEFLAIVRVYSESLDGWNDHYDLRQRIDTGFKAIGQKLTGKEKRQFNAVGEFEARKRGGSVIDIVKNIVDTVK